LGDRNDSWTRKACFRNGKGFIWGTGLSLKLLSEEWVIEQNPKVAVAVAVHFGIMTCFLFLPLQNIILMLSGSGQETQDGREL